MENHESDHTEDAHPIETPQDVASLYSWANLHGAKYRDFSASRREYRAQVRHRAAEQTRLLELEAQAEAEAAARAADAEVQGAEAAARQNLASEADASHQQSLQYAQEAARKAAADRVEATRRAEAAAIAEATAAREAREMAEAHASAQRQAARYANAEVRRRLLAGPQPQAAVPGRMSDPYTPPSQDEFGSRFAEPASSRDLQTTRHRPVSEAPEQPRFRDSEPERRRRPESYRPDEASGIRHVFRPAAREAFATDSEPVRISIPTAPRPAVPSAEAQEQDAASSDPRDRAGRHAQTVDSAWGSTRLITPESRPETYSPAFPALSSRDGGGSLEGFRTNDREGTRQQSATSREDSRTQRQDFRVPENEVRRAGPGEAAIGGGYRSVDQRIQTESRQQARQQQTGVRPPSDEPDRRGEDYYDPKPSARRNIAELNPLSRRTQASQAPAPEDQGSYEDEAHYASMRPAADPASHAPQTAGPAWLYSSQTARSRTLQPPPPPTASPVADTLQHSRERVAARWFALKGVFDSGEQAPEPKPPLRQQEIRVPVLAVFSLAGGVGKTSLVATLGRALSSMGEKVLLADTTSHGLLPFYFGASELKPGVVRTFSPPAGSTDAPIYLVSYDIDQREAEREARERLVGELNQNLAGRHRVVLDLNAASGWIVRRMARMNPIVLVPVAPDMNSVISLQGVEKHFAGVLDSDDNPIQPLYLMNQFDATLPLHLDVREVLRRQLGERLLPFVIRRAPAVSEALAEGMTVVDYAPDAQVAADYLSIASWLRGVSPPAAAGFRNIRWSER